MVGQTVSHYRVNRRLGGGGMGEVYEALDTSLGRRVAIKFLSSSRAKSHESVLRFEREARAASALNHPHICTIHEFGLSDERPFIVMELLDGQTLRERLKSAPFGTPVVVDLGCQVADALEAAHAARIIHRDITPANIFVTSAGHVKILDFGLAKLTPEKDFYAAIERGEAEETHEELLTSPGAALGTTAYMSPEQVRADPLDQRTDLFSFGCVLYEMATGRRAFEGRTSALIFDAILREMPVAPKLVNPSVPDDLDRLIRKALEKDPDLRYQTAREIKADLLRLDRDSGAAAAEPGGVGSGARRDGRRSRSHSGVGAASESHAAASPEPRGVLRRALPWLAAAAVIAAGAAGFQWLRARSAEPEWAPSHFLTTEAAADLEPALSPDGRTLAFTRKKDGASRVWLLDVKSGDQAPLTAGARETDANAWHPDERSPAWNPREGMVYFVADYEGRPAVWKAPSWPGGSPTLVIGDANEPALSPDGTTLAFVRSGPEGADRIWLAGLPELNDAHPVTGDGPEFGLWEHREPAWSPDGTRICYRAQRDLFTVTATSTGIGTVSRLTKDDARDVDPVWSADGRLVYFASFRDNTTAIWSARVPAGSVKRVTRSVGPEGHPTVSADGSTMVYTNAIDDPNIVIHDLHTGDEYAFGGSRDDEMPAFLPDLSAVVFLSNRSDGYRLWVQAINGGRATGEPRQLTDQAGSVANPTVSPDGRWVAYYRVLEGQRDIWIASLDGGPALQFTDDPATDIHPAWSPDGTRLAFVSDRSGKTNQVFVSGVQNGRPVGTPVQITSGSKGCRCPTWSPDGKTIAFVSPEKGDVYLAPSDGRGPATPLTTRAFARRLRWNPVAGTLLVSGGWGRASSLALREVDPADRKVYALVPPVLFGDNESLYDFDVSSDGRWLALSREEVRGNLCSLTALRAR
jgi:Tol biopolymer transport system component